MKILHLSTANITLAVRIWGDNNTLAPTLIMVHGFPDNSLVWQTIAEQLSKVFRVVAYDVRGAGDSSIPKATSAYKIRYLVDDLAAVIDAVSPSQAVHLIGHDWGAIQCWEAVTTPRLAGRIASFTSISGPSLDHAAYWMRQGLSHGSMEDRRKIFNQWRCEEVAASGEIFFMLYKIPKVKHWAYKYGEQIKKIALLL